MNRLSIFFAFALLFTFVPLSLALVPGPILIQPDTIQQSRSDDSRRLQVPDSRAKAACLKIEGIGFCPGIATESFQQKYETLSESAQNALISFHEKGRLQGLVVFMPQKFQLPAPNFKTGPMPLGPEPQPLETITAHYPERPVRQELSEVLVFKHHWAQPDLSVRYFAQQHLGLITHTSEQGEYVVGAFVSK